MSSFFHNIGQSVKNIVIHLRGNAIVKKSAVPLAAVTTFLLTVGYWNCQTFVLALEYNGKTIVNVSDERTYEETKKMLSKQLPTNEKSKLEVIQIKITPVSNQEVCESPNDIKDKVVESSQENFVEACGVYIKDELVAVGKDKESVELVINNAIEEEKLRDSEIIVELSENPDLKIGLFAPEDVLSGDDLKLKLFSPEEKSYDYKIVEGDTPESVSGKFLISESKLLSDNCITEDEFVEGKMLKVNASEPILSLNIFKMENEERELPFCVEKRENENELKKWSKILQEGETGKESVLYRVEYKNGLPISKVQIDCKVVKEPKSQIIEVGTQTFEFMWPVSFTKNITSPYGQRGKSFHKGIDIACSGIAGKDIISARSGVVEKVSSGSTGYGNCVVIKHDNGFETRYAHCCKICVSQGQKVSQGEVIATVGNTGDSDGAHLHFEIIKNGVHTNPEGYFK